MRLDAAAFERLQRKRRFRPQTLEIAKRRLIGGERASELAAAYGVHIKRIYMIESQVMAAWKAVQLPEGWEEVTLVAPKALVREFQRRARVARKK